MLNYFDAFLIGLTATPDNRTFGFFNKNIVSEYTHEQAVLDNVNVGREGTFLIETDITNKGGKILKQVVQKRERLSRKKRWEQLDENVDYVPSQLARDIVNPTQIQTIIKAFASSWRSIFPDREELPKTLVFAKTDSHADDIITVIREEFGEGNEFCKKVTYGAEDPKSVLSSIKYNVTILSNYENKQNNTADKQVHSPLFLFRKQRVNFFQFGINFILTKSKKCVIINI